MTNDPTATPQPHDPANPPPRAGAEEFAYTVHQFWEKNRSFIFLFIAVVVLSILGREGWDWFQASRERAVQAEYAKVADRVDQLPKFAEANKGHALAGVAWLRVADEAYTKNDFRGAALHYQKSVDLLDNAALKSRARLGAAMSQFAAGDKAAAETSLKALGADAKAADSVRAEATYHLATLANEAGQTEEAKRLIEEISRIDAAGLWAQRGFMLRAQIEAAQPAAAPIASPASTIEFKTGK